MVVNNQVADKRRSLSLTALNSSGQFDIAELVNRVIERFGRHQVLIYLLLCTNSIIVAINHTLTTFHIYTPALYQCSDETTTTISVSVKIVQMTRISKQNLLLRYKILNVNFYFKYVFNPFVVVCKMFSLHTYTHTHMSRTPHMLHIFVN